MRRPRRPVDTVVIVLAMGLAGTALGILAATTVQIVRGNPDIALSDNATQVLVAAVGALTGLLGGYIGSRRPPGPPDPPDDADGPTDDLKG
jgi:F0F1-type ATP synthase membrane subunit c/vacuolar-type H+-ATPase subunit K